MQVARHHCTRPFCSQRQRLAASDAVRPPTRAWAKPLVPGVSQFADPSRRIFRSAGITRTKCPCSRALPLRAFLITTEPLVMNALIGAILADGEQRSVDRPAQRASAGKGEGAIALVKFTANHPHKVFALMHGVVAQRWRPQHHGIYPSLYQGLHHVIKVVELTKLRSMPAQIVGRDAALQRTNTLSREIVRTVD